MTNTLTKDFIEYLKALRKAQAKPNKANLKTFDCMKRKIQMYAMAENQLVAEGQPRRDVGFQLRKQKMHLKIRVLC